MPTSTRLVLPAGKRRTSWLMRMIRAVWRDTSALLHEFRQSIILFVLVTVVGGWLYGELHVLAGHERIPFVDLPYIMTALMILEASIEVPKEPYLIAFWYAMPPIAIYIIGRGAADFVRLFFNRNERRDAWEEAVASTYRNHVVVLGSGHVGVGVIRTLVAMGFEVVAIDLKVSQEMDDEMSALGVPVIIGDGRSTATLEKAGILHADSFLACTSNDYINLEAIMRVRDMSPQIRIVSRMWDNKFVGQLKQFMGVQAVLSSAILSAPAFAGAAVGIEITQTLTIEGEDFSMIRLEAASGSFLDGCTIDELQTSQNIDIVLHSNGSGANVHPEGDIRVKAGDTLVIFALHRKITEIVARNKPNTSKPGLGRRVLGRG